jgi:glycosyltransferase involved in cell wall biosynthesis
VTMVRVYSPDLPFPPNEGNFLTVYDQIQTLAVNYNVEVVSWRNTAEDFCQRRQRAEPAPIDQRVRWRHLEPGRLDRGWIAVLKRFLDVLLNRMPSTERFYYPLSLVPIMSLAPRVHLEVFHHTFAYSVMRGMGRVSTDRRVCMVHDIASDLYEIRSRSRRNSVAKWLDHRNAVLAKRHEARLGDVVDELWFVSPVEMAQFTQAYGNRKARLVSPTFSERLIESRRREFDATAPDPAERCVFGLLGDLRHTPNRESALFILHRVAPLLAARGFRGEMRIIGRGADDELVAAARVFPFIRMEGFVPNLAEFWKSLSFMLVPDVCGTGVRMKMLEALASGVPTIATHEAVRRLHPTLQSCPLLTVLDDPTAWADFLCMQAPRQVRRRFLTAPVPSALLGKNMYAFLWEDTQPPRNPLSSQVEV